MNRPKEPKLRNKILFYTMSTIHIPWTLIRVVLASIVLVDMWCDKVIYGLINEVEEEIKKEKLNEN